MPRVVTPLNQDRLIDPFKQRVSKWNDAEPKVYLSRTINSLLAAIGNDFVLSGFTSSKAFTNTDVSVTFDPGKLIQDLTYLEMLQQSTISFENANQYPDSGRFVVVCSYVFLETVEDNPFRLEMVYVYSDGTPAQQWSNRYKTVIDILEFKKDSGDNIIDFYESQDQTITVNGQAYYKRGISHTNINLETVRNFFTDNLIVVSENYSPKTGEMVCVDPSAGNIEITLPLNPNIGYSVSVVDYKELFETYPVTVKYNGSRIVGNYADYILDDNGVYAAFRYVGGDKGWIIEKTGTSSGGGTAGDGFKTIVVPNQSSVVANTAEDSFTLTGGTNVIISTDPITSTITISAAGGPGADIDCGPFTARQQLIQFYRGTKEQLDALTDEARLKLGEFAYTTDTHQLFVGGATLGTIYCVGGFQSGLSTNRPTGSLIDGMIYHSTDLEIFEMVINGVWVQYGSESIMNRVIPAHDNNIAIFDLTTGQVKDSQIRFDDTAIASPNIAWTSDKLGEALDNINDVITNGGGSITIGTPDDGSYTGLLSLHPTDKISNTFDQVNDILSLLAPAKPQNLSEKTLILTTYSALEAGSGSLHTCTDDTTPTLSVSNFWDGDRGILSAEVDSTSVGSKTLSTASDIGSYGALNITDDSDPYFGQTGKEGFWKQLSANITPQTALSYDLHTFQMKHSITGNTPVFNVYVDNPTTTTITGVSFALPSDVRYISGVPSLYSGQTISTTFTVNNAVRKHYNQIRLASISGSQITTKNPSLPATPPVENISVTYSNESVSVSGGYSENMSITITPYNAKGTTGSVSNNTTGARIDTISNETIRKTSGSGDFPTSGYGETFNSENSLQTIYVEELQLLNGLYQIPSGNYSSNLPIAGPDYSTGMGTSYRWVTFIPTTLNNNVSFKITFNNTAGTWSGVETIGIKIYARVVGSSPTNGWIDCNKNYSGTGNPTNDGDAAMKNADSTSTIKTVTFGSVVKTGSLYIRIGLPNDSNKKFSGITISNII